MNIFNKQRNALSLMIRIFLLTIFWGYSFNTFAQYDPALMESSSVRVIAKGVGKTRASSGFLWKTPNQVVTSLHAIPGGSKITVECRGVSKPATVKKTLPKADLILLEVSGLPSSCSPFTDMNRNKPAPFSTLYTYGYHAGAKSGTARKFEKGHANPERLNTLITGVPLQAIKDFGMPDTKLDIYYVQGGLLPGYSGGPVVNDKKQLVGIVDGGLNKGTSSYNWVIPAKYLDELTASSSSTIPSAVARSSDKHFSTGIEEVKVATVIEYQENGVQFSWVLTKTQSLAELASTADDAEGVAQLYDWYASSAGVASAEELVFDVYEELTQGLIIAIPQGQPFEYGPDSDGDDWLTSSAVNNAWGFSGIRFAFNDWDINDDLKNVISPNDPNYFNHLITELLLECVEPGRSYCELLPGMTRMLDYGGGNKILRLGMASYDSNSQPLRVSYYSFAVKDNKPFGAEAVIASEGGTGLFQCIDNPSHQCQNTAAAKRQLAQMIGVHLTSFAGLTTEAGNSILQTEFIYDNQWDDPTTWYVPYYEGNEVRFFNTRGAEWRVYQNGDYEIGTTVLRDEAGFIQVEQGGVVFQIPISGGTYSIAQGGQWVSAGEVMPSRRFSPLGYFDENGLRFLFDGVNAWISYQDGMHSQFIETRRDMVGSTKEVLAVLQQGELFRSVPVYGGPHKVSTQDNQWQTVGNLSFSQEPDKLVFSEYNSPKFIYLGQGVWRIHEQYSYVDVNEAQRYTDELGYEVSVAIPYQGKYIQVPLYGGEYSFSTPDGGWTAAGIVTVQRLD